MRFGQFYAELTRLGTPYSLAMIDLDQFKKVNESQGYFAGDERLQKFAAFVRRQVRSNDVLTRVEGDTFALLLPNTVSTNAVRLLQRILHASKNSTLESFPFTFSASVMEVDLSEEQVEVCIKKLESALQEAKSSGGGRVAEVKQDKVALTQTVKIAVVDDDPIIRSVLSQILRKITVPLQRNIEFRTFPDGLDFLESDWGADNCPYLIILDGMMPKMDGLEVLQKIRKERRRDRYSIMMLTTRKNDSDIERAMQLGADDYMTKPFKMAELEARIESLIMRMNA
jgi:diguanylate cyclase (GGDEF)-like protein